MATSLNVRQGNQLVEGQHSAAVVVLNSGGKLTSLPMSSLGPVSSTVTLQVRLPAYLAGQNFQGQVALWLNSPTAGILNQYFGPAQFLKAPTGAFRQVQFTLPATVVSALSTKVYSDLTAAVQFDFNPNPNPNIGFADPFYVDRLDFGQGGSGGGAGGAGGLSGSGGVTGAGGTGGNHGGSAGIGGRAGASGAGGSFGSGGVAGTASAGTAGMNTSGPCTFGAQATGSAPDIAFTIKLPVGVRRENIGVATTGGFLTLDDGVSVVKDLGGFASVSSVLATSRTNLGVAVAVQDAYSDGAGLDLRTNAHVHGVLRTTADETAQTGAAVDGGVVQHTSLQPLESISWTVSFPNTNHGSCMLQPDNTEVIDPGSYGDIVVKSRSHLKVRSGTYYFNSLSFDPQSVLDIDNRSGPVFLYVRTTFGFSGTIVESDTAHMNFMFGVAGNGSVNVQSAFRGILVAPFASLSLPTDTNVGHVGAFFAASVIAHQNTVIHQRALTPAEFCSSTAACSSFCPCGSDGGVCAGTPSTEQPATSDPNCSDGACCPAGASVVTLTVSPDTYSNSAANACIVALAGGDSLSSSAPGATLVAGPGNDIITSSQFLPSAGAAPVRVFGGQGNDSISGWFDGAQIYGGPGDDTISAGPGSVLIVPGSGVDNVSSGDGNDTFILYSECEATAGKKLLANGGFDTLITPLTVAELRARGVTVEGFENVIIASDACKSDCAIKPTCGAGSQCADRGGQPVCGGGTGSGCQTCNDCASGLSCASGTCQSPCVVNPQGPGCAGAFPQHCSNGVRDGDETDLDCGGSCDKCHTGGGCNTNTDCGSDLVCGSANGACFGRAHAQGVCWKPACELGTDAAGCGSPDSPCGQNCACVTGCDATNPVNTCPSGEVCKEGLSRLFNSAGSDACVDPRCPSNDPALCGTGTSVCGAACICTPDCSTATCDKPGDGCGGICPKVCSDGQHGCTDDVECGSGFSCIAGTDGVNTCHPSFCAFQVLAPPLCGTAGAPCGAQCPSCTPSCEGRQCGLDPSCGQSCGTCNADASCNIAGQCVAPTSNAPLTTPDGKGGTKPVTELPSPVNTSTVGALKGQFRVSEQGAASYSVPIEVPPGRAGMEPALSLEYVGSRANGQEGVGWHLEGLSKITRCASSFALDRTAGPVRNDPSDHFCIDGKRLEAVSGVYGTDGAEYRTLIDSFAKVVSHVETGSGTQLSALGRASALVARNAQGPDWFQVWTKDGRILTYGKTRDSLVLAHNGVRYTWLLNRVDDRAGNVMLVSYTNLSMSVPFVLTNAPTVIVRPSIISYTGHAVSPTVAPSVIGNREVRFTYEARNDPQLSFTPGGSPFVVAQRLSRVTTFANSRAVKNYKLQYAQGSLSQIEKIFDCAGGDDSRCKAPTTFGYIQEHGFAFSSEGIDLQAAGQLDVNGDGIPDFLATNVLVDGVPSQPTLKAAQVAADVAVSIGSLVLDEYVGPEAGFAVSLTWDQIKGPFWAMFAKTPTITLQHTLQMGTGLRSVGAFTTVDPVQGLRCNREHPAFMLDYDQDGRDDVVSACGTDDNSLFVDRSVGDGTFEPYPTTAAVLTVPIGAVTNGKRGDLLGRLAGPILIDVDGDGLQDVVSCKDQFTVELRRRLAPPGGFEPTPISLATDVPVPASGPHPPPTPPRALQILCGGPRPTFNSLDVDGDGTPDLLVRGPKDWEVLRFSKPNDIPTLSWQPAGLPDVGASAGGKGLNSGDFNGDGLVDVFSINPGKPVVIWLNTGSGFFSRTLDHPKPDLPASPRYDFKRLAVLDYNADSRDDFIENWSTGRLDLGSNGVFETDRFNWSLLPDSQVRFLDTQVTNDLRWPALGGGVAPGDFTITGDVDGDGSADLFGVDSAVFFGLGARNTLLRSVVDGLGKTIHISYAGDTATSQLGYHFDDACKGASWPEKCLKRLNGVVAGHTEGVTDQAGTFNIERDYSYTFTNARMSLTGHGWLGFDRKSVSVQSRGDTNDAGITTTIDYEPVARYDLTGVRTTSVKPPYLYPLAGLPKRITTDRGVATLPPIFAPLQNGFYNRRTQVVNDWSVKLSSFNRPFPAMSSRTSSIYDRPAPGGINPQPTPFEENGIPLNGCTETFQTDSYGNTTSDAEDCRQGDNLFKTLVTTSVFTPDPLTWLISLPDSNQVFSSEGDTAGTRKFGFTYLGGLLASVTRAPGGSSDQQHTSTYSRDDFGNIKQIIESTPADPSRTTSITYDNDGIFPSTVINAAGQTTQISFDVRWGDPLTLVDPNGIITQAAYDDFGRVTTSSGPDGTSIATYANVVAPSRTTAAGAIDPRIQVSVERQGTAGTRAGAKTTEYDSYLRSVRTITEGFGGVQVIAEQVYDALGRVRARTRAHTAGLNQVPFDHYTFDEQQRLTRVDHSDGLADRSFKEYQYASTASLADQFQEWIDDIDCSNSEAPGCAFEIQRSIDEEGRQDVTISDYVGKILRNVDGDNVANPTRSNDYFYGAFGQLVQINNNHDLSTDFFNDDDSTPITKFKYDDYGRLATETDPDTGNSVYTYNGYDELKTSTDPKHQLRTYHHDSLGRLDSVVDSAGTTQWVFDQGVNALGRISESISPSTPENPAGQHIRYGYEPPTATGNRGSLQNVTYAIDGTEYAVNLEYDDLGRSSRVHYPKMGTGQPIVAKYSYDSSGMLHSVVEAGSGVANPLWTLDEAFQGHLIQQESFGNGSITTYNYRPDRHWLEGVQTTLGTGQIQSLEYTHYNNGLVHQLNTAGVAPREYLYDNLNRLSSLNTLSNPPASTPYSYDALGNLTGRGATVTTYQPAHRHLIATVGDNTYGYDANGNVSVRTGPDVPGGNQLFDYTPFDLPKSITTGGVAAKTTQFDYSADGQRLVRRDGDSSIHFVTDLYQRKLDNVGTTLEEHFRLYAGDRQIGEIVRKDGVDRTLFFHTDHLGSTETISDSNGGTTTQQFDPFGKPESPPTPELTRVGFTGQDQDVDLGLTDMKGRIYDPLAGRFTSADPVTQAPFWSQGLNRYSYVFNDPINNTDPSGFESEGLWAGAGAFAAVDLGLLCYGTDCLSGLSFNGGTVGTGLGFGAANIGISYLTGQYDLFNGSGPSKQSARPPSGAPKSSGMNRNAPGALGQNMEGIGIPPSNGKRHSLSTVPNACPPDGCDPFAALGMVPEAGVVIEEAEVGVRLLSRLLPKLFRGVGREAFGETIFKGLVRNRALSELTDAEIRKAFENTSFKLSSHAVKRLRDPRAASFGFRTLRDFERLLNKGVIEQAGRETVLVVKDGFEAVVNTTTKVIVTFSPY